MLDVNGLEGEPGGNVPFKLQRDGIRHDDHYAEQQTSRLRVPQRDSDKVGRAAPVHRVGDDVEWEARDHVVHQDAKIVAEVRARHAQHVHRRDNQHITHGK